MLVVFSDYNVDHDAKKRKQAFFLRRTIVVQLTYVSTYIYKRR